MTTADGTYGIKGFVTAAMGEEYSYFYACGPEAMLKAVADASVTGGQLSFEERMGCGFGACMGCSCENFIRQQENMQGRPGAGERKK